MGNKVGIVTLNGYKNYGNRLQNYALQQYLKSLDNQVETVLVQEDISIKKRVYKLIFKVKNIFSLISPSKRQRNKYKKIREEKFRSFTKRNIYETNYTISNPNRVKNKLNDFDYFVVGSDQVWNPHYIKQNDNFFLTFAPKNKRIAYAPSFGTSKIPDKYKESYTKFLKGMNYLSSREDAGARIITALTNRKVPVLVDPTLLLTKDEWLSIMKDSGNKPSQKYLLTYFLGDLKESDKVKINKIAYEYNLKIIELASLHDKEVYTADPGEFLDYINSSTLFLTDSFHGVVFSILFEKPFLVLKREGRLPSMYSRIETLLKKFELKDREWENLNNIDLFKVDYKNSQSILEEERNKSKIYLVNALKG